MNIKKSILNYGLKQGIARKLIVYLLVFSSLVTLILTSIQLYLEYNRDIQQIENRLELIEKSYLASIATGLWSFDETLLKVQLEGIVKMPDIQYIEIRPNTGKSLSAGIFKKSNIKRKEFNLSFLRKEKENPVGILLVDVNLGGVYTRLINRVVIILLSQSIKTFLVSLFIFFLFYQLVGKHIISMASFFESIQFKSMDQPLQLDRKPKTNKPDELDQLVTSFNRMKDNLARDILRREIAEKELSVSEYRLFTHLQNTPVGALSWDLNFKGTEWNPAAEAIFGYSKAETMGKHVTELILPEEQKEMVDGIYRDLISGKGGGRSTNENMTKDGRRIMCDWHNTILKDADGKIIGAASLVQDITERKQAEEKLRESEKKYRTLFENMVQGVFYQRTGGVLVDFNNAALEMFGLSSDQFLGRTSLDPQWKVIDEDGGIIPGDKHPSMVALQTGKPVRDKIVGVYNPRTKYYNWLVVNAIPQFNKGEEKPYQVFVTLQDITEQKKAVIEIIKAKQKAERYLNLAGVMFVGLDIDGNINVANKKACQILEAQQKDILGQNWFDNYIPQNVRHEIHSVFKQLIDGIIKPVEYYENQIITKTGKEKQIAWHNTILKDDDNIIGILSSGEDITEKRKLQFQLQQTQKMEAIGTLAGGIAHDFNNILFPILGHTEMLLEDIPEDSPIRPKLDQICTSAMRASKLVKQILTFSRQESGKLNLMKMQPIIKEALKLIRSTIPTTIEIKQDISPACDVIKADPTQIHQIVMNLATNAYHAMEEIGGELKVGLKQMELGTLDLINPDMTPGEYACLTVADTGKGMDKKLTQKIFDPFFTTKAIGKGTGMGLSVVHGIVAGMGGAIQVYSEPGKGTEFKVYFPVEQSSFEKQSIQTKEPIQGGTERILLVDDEDAIIKMEKLMLGRLGYQVTSRASSIEALEAFRDSPDKFDLVITDMAMPNMPGNKLSAELVKIRSDIPILLCTGFSETMSEETAASLGIKGFLLKPIVMKDLSQKIREVLD